MSMSRHMRKNVAVVSALTLAGEHSQHVQQVREILPQVVRAMLAVTRLRLKSGTTKVRAYPMTQ